MTDNSPGQVEALYVRLTGIEGSLIQKGNDVVYVILAYVTIGGVGEDRTVGQKPTARCTVNWTTKSENKKA